MKFHCASLNIAPARTVTPQGQKNDQEEDVIRHSAGAEEGSFDTLDSLHRIGNNNKTASPFIPGTQTELDHANLRTSRYKASANHTRLLRAHACSIHQTRTRCLLPSSVKTGRSHTHAQKSGAVVPAHLLQNRAWTALRNRNVHRRVLHGLLVCQAVCSGTHDAVLLL